MMFDDMYKRLLEMRRDMPKLIGPWLIVCHPDDLQKVIDGATANGYIIVPFDDTGDDWRFRAVYISEVFGRQTVTENFIMVSERNLRGDILTIDLSKHWICGLSNPPQIDIERYPNIAHAQSWSEVHIPISPKFQCISTCG